MLVAIFAAVGVLACSTDDDDAAGPSSTQQAAAEGYQIAAAIGMTLEWKADGESLDVILTGPTSGWVGVGFDPTRMMQDANLIIAYVADGELTVRDDYGNWLTSHASDMELGGTSDLSNATGEETTDGTTARFTIPLDSGDQYDRPLVPGETYTVLLACGAADDLSTIHRNKAKVTITL